MKNLLIFIFATISFISYSQHKPVKNYLGIGIDYKLKKEVHIINPYIFYPDHSIGFDYNYRVESINYFPALKLDYYLKECLSVNLYYRPTFINENILNEQLEPSAYLKEGKVNHYLMDLGLGVEKHFFKKQKIDPFVGLNFHYLYAGQEKLYTKTVSNYENKKYIRKQYTTGVESHGIFTSANFGFNYFILKNFSIGINMDLGYKYTLQKGNSSIKRHDINYINGVEVKNETSEPTTKINIENKSFVYTFSLKTAFYLPMVFKKSE